ncbi:glycerophosphoryl diester phosphodiesterase [Xenococcus sp. PCC 7305]|uniref:glycerophosphodiester phosphodiesterase n=1 Tax=Xenococcus sp. PCC 7305 TaxID=102125 RepID=UPI0002AC21B4|nr:glycerophosphodiester phosphodiesterase family protein [Xenococcus sp. PCC 7305]ELS03876.1 glycerophosphoryl diester phosphodiesterase [Xenococcus sp. PCC 7305]
MLCIGHRGAMGYEPENTLLSIAKALTLKVDWIEIDVYNVENNLIVFHDRDLSRTTNGTGNICDRSFDYLRTLDAGQGQQIPTLIEVCDLVNRRCGINIELKGIDTAGLVVKLIQEYIEQGWQYQDFLVSSFNHYELKKVKDACPQIVIGIIIYGLPLNYLEIAAELQAVAVIMSCDFVTKEIVANIQNREFKAFVYTVNKPEDINNMKLLNVDGIFCNYPDRCFG